MVNSSAHKMIRLVYEKQGGVWHLALMESSDGVSQQVTLPHFNTSSTQPHHLHVREILESLLAADLEGGSVTQTYEQDKYEVHIRIVPAKARKTPKEVQYAKNHDLTVEEAKQELILRGDDDTKSHHAMFAQARARLMTEDDSLYWLRHCQARLATPDGLYSGPPRPEVDPDKR